MAESPHLFNSNLSSFASRTKNHILLVLGVCLTSNLRSEFPKASGVLSISKFELSTLVFCHAMNMIVSFEARARHH